MIDFARARTTMVDAQVRPSDVTRYPIIEAMLTVPREAFVPREMAPVAYAGDHVPLGPPGRVLLDPRVFAKLMDWLEVGRNDLVLDVGAGLGYSTAVLARLAEAVVALESDEGMAADAAETLAAQGADNAAVSTGPLAEGDTAHGPYDVIVIEGGVEKVPEALIGQLKEGGRIGAIFMAGQHAGRARLGVKTAAGMAWRHAFDATAPVLEGFEEAPAFRF